MEKKKELFNLVFLGTILGVLVLAAIVIMFSQERRPIIPPAPNTPSVPSIPQRASAADLVRSVQPAAVTTLLEQRGQYIVIITRVKNGSYYIKRKLDVYIVDSTGNKRFVDRIDVELSPGETGRADSSKHVNKLGPPPYKVVTEWK